MYEPFSSLEYLESLQNVGEEYDESEVFEDDEIDEI